VAERVLCLRPEEDFLKIGVQPPGTLSIRYTSPADPELAAQVADADALVIPAVGPALPANLFEGSRVRLVQVTGAGVDRLDRSAMERLGIAVANVPGGSANALAEYAVASALTLLRRTAWADAEISAGNYVAARARMVEESLQGLEGLTVGVVGLGIIGTRVAEAFHAMGCDIVYSDPAPFDAARAEAIGAQDLPLPELLREADVVTLHVPLLPATRSLVGEAQLAAMKPGAILVNAARGGVVDEAALARHLSAGRLGGAAVDVFSEEPPGPGNPLLALTGEARGRLLLTPHIAGVTRQSWAFLFRSAWENVERVLLRGEAPLDQVY